MFDELKKYKNGAFSFKIGECLNDICDAPKTQTECTLFMLQEKKINQSTSGAQEKCRKTGRSNIVMTVYMVEFVKESNLIHLEKNLGQ